MFSRQPRGLAAAVCGAWLGLVSLSGAQAQIASEGMDEISAWGERYLSSSEPDFPSNLWSNSDPDILLSLLLSMDTKDLSPTERRLLRRVVLSPAQPLSGADADLLLTERARLMLELGEPMAAAALAPRLEQAALGLEAEALAVDLDLARGRNASACGRLTRPVSDQLYWLQLRAVCAILRDNFSGAELAIEVASARGLDDDWFIEAVFAAAGDVPNPPPARYLSGVGIALSLRAGLDTGQLDPGAVRTDLAAALAQRPDIDPSLRLRFAEIAHDAALLEPEALRTLIDQQFDDPDFQPTTRRDQMFALLRDPLADDADKARRLSDYLVENGQDGLNRFVRAAGLVAPDLAALSRNQASRPFVPVFARTALALGNAPDAKAWLDLAYGPPESAAAPDADLPDQDGESEPARDGTAADDAATPAAISEAAIPPEPVTDAAEPSQTPAAMPDTTPEAGMLSARETLSPTDLMLAAALEADATKRQMLPAPSVEIGFPGLMGDFARLDDILAPPPPPDPFILALIDTLSLLARPDLDPADHPDLTARLITTAASDTEIEQATVLLNLMPAFGFRLDAEARDFLISQPVLGAPIDEHIALAISSAADDLAFAEAGLMMLTQTRGDPSWLSPRDLNSFVRALRRMQADDIAAGLVLEASRFWIVPEGAIAALLPDELQGEDADDPNLPGSDVLP